MKNDTQVNTMTEIKQAIIAHAVDQLNDGVGEGEYACDLHNSLYNMDYFIIGTYQAKEFLGSEVFEAMDIIKNYELSMFGEVTTDLGSPEHVVNMLAYIIGEEALQESSTLSELWGEELTKANLESIASELN